MTKPKNLEVLDLLPLTLDVLASRLEAFKALHDVEAQTRHIDWHAAREELAWIKVTLELVRAFCFLGRNKVG